MAELPSGSPEPTGGYTLSEPRPDEEARRGAFLRELPILIVVALVLAIVLKTFVVQAFYIPSSSMEPTLLPGDRVLVQKVLHEPSRFDVVVFADPDDGGGPDRGLIDGFFHWLARALGVERPEHEDFIKRVIGLPGERVELRDGALYVEGLEVPEPYLGGMEDTRDFGPVEVPGDSLFVLGDNRLNSNDSRFGLGFVPIDKVVGRAFVIVWPPSRVGWLR